MKFSVVSNPMHERERTYPFLAAFDLAMHWFLCGAVLWSALALFGVILHNSVPQLLASVADFVLKVRG